MGTFLIVTLSEALLECATWSMTSSAPSYRDRIVRNDDDQNLMATRFQKKTRMNLAILIGLE
jgi:hypothetical protein